MRANPAWLWLICAQLGCFAEFPEAATDSARPRGVAEDAHALNEDARGLLEGGQQAMDTGPGGGPADQGPPDRGLRDGRAPRPDAAPPRRDAFDRDPRPDAGGFDLGVEDDLPMLAPPATGLVINEVDYDQPDVDDAEFVELLNRGPEGVDLTGYHLEIVNGSNPEDVLVVALLGHLVAGQYFVLGSPRDPAGGGVHQPMMEDGWLQNSHEGIRLIDPNGAPVDSVAYEGPVQGAGEGAWDVENALIDKGDPEGLSRCPDGTDTDDNVADFRLVALSPGRTNPCEVDRDEEG